MKIVKTDKIKINDVKTFGQFTKWLFKEKGIKTSRQTLYYKKDNSDDFDWCEIEGQLYIIFNQKAKNFTL